MSRRPHGPLVAVLEKRGRFLAATPFFDRGRPVVVGRDRRAGPGDLVLVHLAGHGRGHAKVARRLGRPEVARDVIEALMVERGLTRRFPEPAEAEASSQASAAGSAEAASRRDLRHLPTFTIDPMAARDFDDAISAQALGEQAWRVWVHIADVAAHVQPGSAVDAEARRRATSVYVPGAVEPMLPAPLSSHACSLLPGRERLAVTVEMELHGADVRSTSFHRSRVRSDARLDYDRVDRVFARQEPGGEPWAAPLAAAREAAGALARRRADRGALEVDSAEPEFDFDSDGNVTAMRGVVQTESHGVVEHLMIAANEQVATFLEPRRIPTLYRVHEQPEPTSVAALIERLASLEVPTPPVPEHVTPQQAADLVGEVSRLVAAHVRRTGHGRAALTSLVLRALKQAHYSPRNLGHSGLQSPRYCHFTSPIRRYPDLVCHRALLSALGGLEPVPERAELEEEASWCSEREREAMLVERDADDVARCFLLERELRETGYDRVFEGEVVSVVSFGAFVAFGEGYEGLLAVRRMRGDWWELNEQETILHGTRSGRTIRLGDPLQVRVERVDAPRGRVDLVAVEMA
jgi:ribonuclease R